MNNVWHFGAFYKVVVEQFTSKRKKLRNINLLLTGYEFGSKENIGTEVSSSDATRFVKNGYVGDYFREKIENSSIEQLAERIQKLSLSDPALSATTMVDCFRAGEYRISKALLCEYEELLSEGKIFELLAKALIQSVRTPPEVEPERSESGIIEPFSFIGYYKNAEEKFGKMKTLLYTVEERPVKDFYVCNSIRWGYDVSRIGRIIKAPTLEKLQAEAQYALITGAAGIGKSMLMRHFLLEAVRHYEKADTLPILVMLREYQGANTSLLDMAVKAAQMVDSSISADTVQRAFRAGKVKVLLDGVDEIREKEIGNFISNLNGFISIFPDNQFVLSSRKYSSFVNLDKVALFEILPFSKPQAKRLINKLEFLPETPVVKADFLKRLDNEYYDTHPEFASNPLLLTLMLMTFRRFSRLPRRKHIFYGEAYATLLQGHDAQNKPGYVREFLSVDDPEDFTIVFREFCARTYRDSCYEFDKREIHNYYLLLNSAKKIKESQALSTIQSAKMSFSNFLSDADKNTSLLFEEGGTYLFRHRSFQEYFFADYYAQADDASLIRLGNFLDDPFTQYRYPQYHYMFDEGEAFDMLFDMRPDKVERFIFWRFLEAVYGRQDGRDPYIKLLAYGYDSISYSVFDSSLDGKYLLMIKSQKKPRPIFVTHECSSRILTWILSALSIDVGLATEDSFDIYDQELRYKEFERGFLFGHRDNDSKKKHGVQFECSVRGRDEYKASSSSNLIIDSDHKPIVFGNLYTVPFSEIMKNPSQYYSLVNLLRKPSFPAHDVFERLEKYYYYLEQQYKHADALDTSF
jgi:Predicted NTPase (NACHT family)